MNWLSNLFVNFYWSLMGIPAGLLMGDRFWARLRFLAVLTVFLLVLLLGGLIWEQDALDHSIQTWLDYEPGLQRIPHFFLMLAALPFTWESLRYMILPLAALVGALSWGALYVQDIYELKSYRLTLRYLIASLFGIGYPSLEIEDGKRQLSPGKENLLDAIGGPGWVIIRPGSAVLYESLRNPSDVKTAGTHFITRYQTIKEIVDLRDQHDTIDRLAAVTKDGIVVSASDVHYSYRLWASSVNGSQAGRTRNNPYPFSIQAVRNMAYNREVRNGTWASWRETVRTIYEDEIQNYIRRNQVDQVTAPRNYESAATGRQRGFPRLEIQQIYRSPRLRQRFREVGAELVYPEVGHLGVENLEVNDQRVTTWQAYWQGDAMRVLAYSEAKKQAYLEQGRAEAQAEILMAIVDTLADIGKTPADLQSKIHEFFLVRLAQLLEAMQEGNRPPA
jgi:hypothetical protein